MPNDLSASAHAVAVLLSLERTAQRTAPWAQYLTNDIRNVVSNILSEQRGSDARLLKHSIHPRARAEAVNVRTHLGPLERAFCGLIGMLNNLLNVNHSHWTKRVNQLQAKRATDKFLQTYAQEEHDDPPPDPACAAQRDEEHQGLTDRLNQPGTTPLGSADHDGLKTTAALTHMVQSQRVQLGISAQLETSLRAELDASVHCIQSMMADLVHNQAVAARALEAEKAHNERLTLKLHQSEMFVKELLAKQNRDRPGGKRPAPCALP